MHIKLINKNLYLNDYKLKCAVGKRGITSKKREGDKKTPKGSFKFVSLFYRKDRIKKIKSNLKKYVIKKNMGWCDDPYSKYYNKLIRFPFKFGAEKFTSFVVAPYENPPSLPLLVMFDIDQLVLV